MPCCGQKRAMSSTRSVRTQTPSAPPKPHPSIPAPESVLLRTAGTGTLSLRDPRSGRLYLFSDRKAIAVLTVDVDALLRTGALERA